MSESRTHTEGWLRGRGEYVCTRVESGVDRDTLVRQSYIWISSFVRDEVSDQLNMVRCLYASGVG